MKKIKSDILRKELKKINKPLYLFFLFLVLGLILIILGIYEVKQNEDKYIYLNNVIENQNNEENVYAYLTITNPPYSFAKYEDEDNQAFYIVFDSRYFYIAYISNTLYEDLQNVSEENPITIYGLTASVPDEVKEIAIEVYNEGLDEENQITIDDFNNYFGEVYLNNTSLKKLNSSFYVISIIPFTISLVFFCLFITKKIKTTKTLNTLNAEELEKLDSEITSEKTKYYPKSHLILTDNFLISLNHGLIILKYSDLIWIYEHHFKQYGITTSKHIYIMDTKGKRFNIMTCDILNKQTKETIKEIIAIITTKNNQILIGQNKQNEAEINKILKNS